MTSYFQQRSFASRQYVAFQALLPVGLVTAFSVLATVNLLVPAEMNIRRIAIAALATALLSLSAWRGFTAFQRIPSSRRALADLATGIRPPVGRVVGLHYAPEDHPAGVDRFRRLREGLHQLKKADTPAWDLADKGVLRLLEGRCDEAVSLLESAHALALQDPLIMSDLSAAYLCRARQQESSLDLMRSLSQADEAFRIDPHLPEAAFNRCLALESLYLRNEAIVAWKSFLSIDSSSHWAKEARERFKKLEQPGEEVLWNNAQADLLKIALEGDRASVRKIVHRFPQPTLIYSRETLLSAWANAVVEQKPDEVAKILNTLHEIGVALAGITGDHEISDLQASLAPMALHRAEEIAQAVKLIKQGRKLQEEHRDAEALPILQKSHQLIEESLSPLGQWIILWLAVSQMELGEAEVAVSSLDLLSRSLDKRRYPNLAGKVEWIRGMLLFESSQPTLALASFLAATQHYERARSWEDLCAVHSLAAETLEYLGDTEGASRHLWKSLSLSPSVIYSRRVFSIIDELADSAQEGHELDVALLFRNELVHIWEGVDDPVGLAHALRRRAETLVELGRHEDARADLSRSSEVISEISDPLRKEEASAAIALSLGEALVSIDPERALASLDHAFAFYSKNGGYFELPRLFLARYGAYTNVGDREQALWAIQSGIAWIEARGLQVAAPDFRESFLAQGAALFRILIEEEFRDGQTSRAFDLAERSRRLAFLPLAGGQESSTISVEAVMKEVPPGVTYMAFYSLAGQTLAWTINSKGASFAALPVTSAALEELAGEFYGSLSGPRAISRRTQALGSCYDLILRPLLREISPDETLVFVPGGYFPQLPVAACLDRDRGRYLIEDHAVAVSPILPEFTGSQGAAGDRPQSVLAIGNPEVDRNIGKFLSDLEFAEEEAQRIRSLYQAGELLLGSEAQREHVLGELPRHTVVHIGAHALSNEYFPTRSYLALSPTPGSDSGLLYGYDILKLDLSEVEVVVLAACRSARRSELQPEGSMNLAGSFLDAGAQSVVASLWNIEDEISLKLIVDFHEHFLASGNAAKALRHVQLKMLRDGENPDDTLGWAGFQVFL